MILTPHLGICLKYILNWVQFRHPLKTVIEAIKISDTIKVHTTEAYAANHLGLSIQIPMRIELYTNGPKRKIQSLSSSTRGHLCRKLGV